MFTKSQQQANICSCKNSAFQHLQESPVCDEFRKTLSKIGETKYSFYITLRQNSQAFYTASLYLSINKNGCQVLHFRECTIFILQLLNISCRWAKVLYFVLYRFTNHKHPEIWLLCNRSAHLQAIYFGAEGYKICTHNCSVTHLLQTITI